MSNPFCKTKSEPMDDILILGSLPCGLWQKGKINIPDNNCDMWYKQELF